jgi:hypothetical protein
MIARLLGWLAPYLLPAAGAAGAALLLALGVQTVRLDHARAEYSDLGAAWAKDRLARADAARQAEAAARAEESRRAAAQQEVIDAHEKELARLRADAVIADAAAGRLRERVAQLVDTARAAASNPTAAGGGQAGPDAVDLLAELQRRADERAGELARVADERGAGWQACVGAYDSLTGAAHP